MKKDDERRTAGALGGIDIDGRATAILTERFSVEHILDHRHRTLGHRWCRCSCHRRGDNLGLA
jgi:hypothetical protein